MLILHILLTQDDGPWVYLYGISPYRFSSADTETYRYDVSKALVAANATGTFFFSEYIHPL
jgi:hypothetical protein